jgi:hypothetical protein
LEPTASTETSAPPPTEVSEPVVSEEGTASTEVPEPPQVEVSEPATTGEVTLPAEEIKPPPAEVTEPPPTGEPNSAEVSELIVTEKEASPTEVSKSAVTEEGAVTEETLAERSLNPERELSVTDGSGSVSVLSEGNIPDIATPVRRRVHRKKHRGPRTEIAIQATDFPFEDGPLKPD